MSILMPNRIQIRIGIKTMPIHMRILPHILQMMENQNFFTFSHSIASVECFVFLISVKYAIIFGLLDSIMKISGNNFFSKSKVYQLYHLLGIGTDPDPADPDLAK
jgi:hypothetical protein